MLGVLPSELAVLLILVGHLENVSGLATINQHKSKPVKSSVQKWASMVLGCDGLDPGDANITCSHFKLEQRFGPGIDCTAKVPLKTEAFFLNCPPGFASPEDYTVLTCKFPGTWDNEMFTCIEITTAAPRPSSTHAAAKNVTTTKAATKAANITKAVNATTAITTAKVAVAATTVLATVTAVPVSTSATVVVPINTTTTVISSTVALPNMTNATTVTTTVRSIVL